MPKEKHEVNKKEASGLVYEINNSLNRNVKLYLKLWAGCWFEE